MRLKNFLIVVKDIERFVQVCVFLALVSHFYFLGVLADHNADIQNLNVQMMVLVGLNIIWLITGIIRLRKK